MKRDTAAMQRYYTKRTRCYEQAYSTTRSAGFLDNYYRIAWFPLRRIHRYTMDYLADKTFHRILDVGCGTGIYAADLAGRGNSVTALDSCREMIDATEMLVRQHGLTGKVETVTAHYLEWSEQTTDHFGLVVAIGVMDSVSDASEYLSSFRRRGDEVIVTFPVRSLFSPIREFSYRRQGIVGYSYEEQQVRALLKTVGLEIAHFQKIFPGTYWVHARTECNLTA